MCHTPYSLSWELGSDHNYKYVRDLRGLEVESSFSSSLNSAAAILSSVRVSKTEAFATPTEQSSRHLTPPHNFHPLPTSLWNPFPLLHQTLSLTIQSPTMSTSTSYGARTAGFHSRDIRPSADGTRRTTTTRTNSTNPTYQVARYLRDEDGDYFSHPRVTHRSHHESTHHGGGSQRHHGSSNNGGRDVAGAGSWTGSTGRGAYRYPERLDL